MRIKAQGLLNAARWVKEQHGAEAFSQVLQACDPIVRERCASAIAINWHPAEEFVEFLEAAERIVGSGTGSTAASIGEAGEL